MNSQHLNKLAWIVTLLALSVVAVPLVLAGELPAEAQRIWAPTGDLIGTESHATLTYSAMDAYGSRDKLAEDWQRQEDSAGSGLFNWQKIFASGYRMGLRGAATSQSGDGLNGQFDLWGNRPGQFSYRIGYRSYDQFSDRTSEMRAATFGLPPAPPSLTVTPLLDWNRFDAVLRYRLATALTVSGGLRTWTRSGTQGSLLRGATGNAAPGLKGFDGTGAQEAWLGLGYTAGSLALDLVGALRTQAGSRAVGTDHTYNDDRASWRASLGANWTIATGTRIHGHGSVANLENKGGEVWQTNVLTPAGETKTNGGQLGLVQRLGQDLTLRLAAGFQSATTTAATTQDGTALQSVDRDRSRQDYRFDLTHTGLNRTRLDLAFRRQNSTREQVLVAGGSFATDQDKTRTSLVFKGRHRFSRTALLKLKAGWSSLDRDQTRNWDDATSHYWLADYTRDQVDLKVGLVTRPHRLVRLDLGYQLVDRAYETRAGQGATGSKNTHDANRGYANLNWTPRDWLNVYGLVSVGVETWDMGGVAIDNGMGTVNYDGTTWRYVPGAVIQVTPRLQIEAMYEGIRFEDTADTAGDLGVLKSDHDRSLVRLSWQAREKVRVSATYRRHEFAEQRWDNHIHDLYGLSVSGRF